ncbi:MAG: exosortase B [Rubrivivax sp.]|nr:MAG: exosortase B [Rubrivivax sp.]
MTQANVTTSAPPRLSDSQTSGLNGLELVLVLAGLLALYVPTYVILDKTIWNVVGQGHGPVILALIGWLIWQRWPKFVALTTPPANIAGSLMLGLGLLIYVLGHSQDILFLDVGSHFFVFGGLFLLYRGFAGFRVMLFPLCFIIFVIPVPGSIVDQVTAPLKQAVSYTAEHILYWADFPIGRSGVTLTIGPYQLLVADACAGLNSIFALEAIGVFYMSVAQHTSKLRNTLLALLILPISFASNVIRVVTLVLVTYYFGDEVGQGFVHGFAGILLFMVATALTIGTDTVLGFFIKQPQTSKKDAS